MKTTIFLLAFILAFMPALSQKAPDSKPDIELTKKEAELRIQDWEDRVKELENKLKMAEGDLAELKNQLADAKKALEECKKNLNQLIGVSDADVEAFAQQLGKLEGKVREMKRLSDDELADRRSEVEALDAQVQELKANKISILPQFFDRVVQLDKDVKSLYKEKKITTYTVGTWAENRDCLWNIAGKMEIYGDPHQWPRIWQANTDQVRNPDVIFPGQVLILPPKGDKNAEEKKAERRYYRQKREAEAQNAATGGN